MHRVILPENITRQTIRESQQRLADMPLRSYALMESGRGIELMFRDTTNHVAYLTQNNGYTTPIGGHPANAFSNSPAGLNGPLCYILPSGTEIKLEVING